MKGNKYKSFLKANVLFESRFFNEKNLLKEYDQKLLDNKRNEIVSKLGKLKDVQKGMFAGIKKNKIEQYINDLRAVNLSNVCEGTNLKSDLQSKLNDAKQGLQQYRNQIDDPENLLPSLTSDILVIENFCKSESQSTTTQSNTPTQSLQRMYDASQTKNNTPINLDSLKNMRFMDALNTLGSGENYTKDDIINYVKSKVTVKTT
jgi:hypothetical protein